VFTRLRAAWRSCCAVEKDGLQLAGHPAADPTLGFSKGGSKEAIKYQGALRRRGLLARMG